MSQRFASLEDVVADHAFIEVDVALRRGRHIDRDDGDLYQFLVDTQSFLEPLYLRYACELVARPDGYFYLLPHGDRFASRRLTPGEMLVGQTLALLYLDPATVQSGGFVTNEQILSRLSGLVPPRELAKALEPRKQRFDDERVVSELIRRKVGQGLRRLDALGFVELVDDERIRLRAPLSRFAEPIVGLADPVEAMRRLVAEGKVVLEATPGADEPVETDEEEHDE